MKDQHQVFRRLPIDGDVVVNGETLSTPYHVYDGALAALNGTIEVEEAGHALANEPLSPVLDTDGRALSIIWLGDFVEANLGVHREVQISVIASPKPIAPVPSSPMAVQRALLGTRGAVNVCRGLWNDTTRVVSYNREHLLLDARLATIDITRDANAWAVDATGADGRGILTASFGAANLPTGSAGLTMLRQLGWRASVRMLSSRVASAQVANTTRDGVSGGQVAPTFTAGDRHGMREAKPTDRLTVTQPEFAPLDFRLGAVLIVEGLRFAYGRPSPLVSA